MIKTSLIVARAQNNVIGVDNSLPWHLPEDLKYFKQTTLGKPIIMGRKTYESIGRPLPGRTNIVITRQNLSLPEGVVVVSSVEQAIAVAKDIAQADVVDEVMIIGGSDIYRQSLPLADRVYLTKVHAEVEGDSYFHDFDESQWRLVQEQRYDACEKNPYPYSFCVYE